MDWKLWCILADLYWNTNRITLAKYVSNDLGICKVKFRLIFLHFIEDIFVYFLVDFIIRNKKEVPLKYFTNNSQSKSYFYYFLAVYVKFYFLFFFLLPILMINIINVDLIVRVLYLLIDPQSFYLRVPTWFVAIIFQLAMFVILFQVFFFFWLILKCISLESCGLVHIFFWLCNWLN